MLAEVIAIAAEDVQRADRLRLVQQRHDDLRCHAGHELDVARIGREVVDEQRLLAGDTAAPTRPCPSFSRSGSSRVGIADGVGGLQLAAAFVEQVDGKRFERDQAADEARNLGEELVEIEDRGDLAAQIEQRRDDIVLDGGGRCQLVVPPGGGSSVGGSV